MNTENLTPAAVQPSPTPSVDTTRAQALDAIKIGVSDAAQHEQTLAADAQAKAATIIATIPSLMREATKEGLRRKLKNPRFRAELMPIDIDDTTDYLQLHATEINTGTFVSETSLTHAARIIFDHCQNAGLHAFVSRNKPDGQNYVTYSLDISWSLPGADKPTKPKRFWNFL